MDYNLTAPQAIVLLTSTEHSLLYSSHTVTVSLDTATTKHDETKQTATLNAFVARLLFEYEDQHTLAVFAPGQTTLACDDRMSQEEQGFTPFGATPQPLLASPGRWHRYVRSVQASLWPVACPGRALPETRQRSLGCVAQGQPPPSAVRSASHCYLGEVTSPFCFTTVSFSSGAEGACVAASGGAGGSIALRFEATQICFSCVPAGGDS